MKSSFLYSIVWAVLLTACRTENKKSDFQKGMPLQELTTIRGYPDDFVGCGCALSRTAAEYAAKEFVYLEKYGLVEESMNYNMISLNGKEIKWNKEDFPKEFTVEVTYDKTEDKDSENMKKTGKMIITFKDGTVLQTMVVGVCGC